MKSVSEVMRKNIHLVYSPAYSAYLGGNELGLSTAILFWQPINATVIDERIVVHNEIKDTINE